MAVKRDTYITALDGMAAWSLYLLILFLPISKSMIEVMIVVGLVAIVLKKILARERLFELSLVNVCAVIFVVSVLPSFMNSGYLALTTKAFFSKVLKFVALFLLAQEALNTRVKMKNFMIMALISCIVIVGDAFVQHFVTHRDLFHYDGLVYQGYPSFQFSEPTLLTMQAGHSPYPEGFLGRPTASFPFPNDFASWILVMIFPVWAFVVKRGERLGYRIGLALLGACLGFFLIVAGARSAWIGFVAALFLIPLMRVVDLKKLAVAVVLVGVVLGAAIWRGPLAPHVTAVAGIADRHVMWKNAWTIFEEHPIVGTGLNTFFREYKKVRTDEHAGKRGSYAHNCYLQMAAETGILGLGSFLLFIGSVLVTAIRRFRASGDPFVHASIAGLTLGAAAFLVHAFFDTNLYSLNLAALFWVSFGLLASVVSAARRSTI